MKGARIILYAAALLLAAYFVWFAIRALDANAIAQAFSSPAQVVVIVVASLLYAGIIPVTGWAWSRLLAGQSEQRNGADLAVILGLTQLAKYVPGNVAQHATRAALALRSGLRAKVYFSTLAQETLLAVAASLMVGFALLAWSGHRMEQLPPSTEGWLSLVAVALGAAVILLASVRLKPEELHRRRGWAWKALALAGGLPGPSITLLALAAYIFNYLIIGIGLWLLSVYSGAGLSFSLVTAAFALSWALGFLAPGAPAGLGAREGIMLLLLQGAAPPERLAVFVLLARLVTVLGDLICFAVASILSTRRTTIGPP